MNITQEDLRKSTVNWGGLIIINILLEIRDIIFGINFLSKYYNPTM